MFLPHPATRDASVDGNHPFHAVRTLFPPLLMMPITRSKEAIHQVTLADLER
jgi:hypothetical protein